MPFMAGRQTGFVHPPLESFHSGGNAYNDTHRALKINYYKDPDGNIKVNTIDIIDPTKTGVLVQGGNVIDKVWLSSVTITNPGRAAV